MASIYQSIEILSKEKGINPQIVLDAVKDAMLVAARKHYRTNAEMEADFDPKAGSITIYALKKVVEKVEDPDLEVTLQQAKKIDASAELDGNVRIAMSTDALGRISAQTAKQVILQKVREAERETVYIEYADRVGDLVNCTVKRVEGLDLLVDLGKTEARLPKKEQSRAESYSVGDRIRCVIKSVEKAGKNAGVTVSRAAPELVMRLFEQEVPEIYDGTVAIRACAREAGERTKIAVVSRDRDVDSVGACVGMKGMRVQSIIRELRGEKIDIIQFSDDPVVFATNALSPAKITRVAIVDSGERAMEVIVDDSQLSLAIGKKGQNVRLAAKLLGWRIDIKSEEEKRQEVESEMSTLVAPGAPVSVLLDHGLSDEVADKLREAGVNTVEMLGAMTPEDLETIPGIGPEAVETARDAVVSYYGQFEAEVTETETAELSGMPDQEAETFAQALPPDTEADAACAAPRGLEAEGAGESDLVESEIALEPDAAVTTGETAPDDAAPAEASDDAGEKASAPESDDGAGSAQDGPIGESDTIEDTDRTA